MSCELTTQSFYSELIETVCSLFVAYTKQTCKDTHLYDYSNSVFTDILSMVLMQLNSINI